MRIFSDQRHQMFAILSRDFNPIHMDPVAARRTQAGAPVVHGVHALLELIDEVALRVPVTQSPISLKATFRKMIYIGDEANVVIDSTTHSNPAGLRAHLLVGGVEVVALQLQLEAEQTDSVTFPPSLSPAAIEPPPAIPLQPAFEEMAGSTEQLRFATPSAEFAEMFPQATRWIAAARVAAPGRVALPGRHGATGSAIAIHRTFCIVRERTDDRGPELGSDDG